MKVLGGIAIQFVIVVQIGQLLLPEFAVSFPYVCYGAVLLLQLAGFLLVPPWYRSLRPRQRPVAATALLLLRQRTSMTGAAGAASTATGTAVASASSPTAARQSTKYVALPTAGAPDVAMAA